MQFYPKISKSRHQTAVFIEISAGSRQTYRDRVTRLIGSINRTDTIKADIYFVTNGQIIDGFDGTEAPPLGEGVPGLMDLSKIHAFTKAHDYNVQLIVSDPHEDQFVPELDPEAITKLLEDM